MSGWPLGLLACLCVALGCGVEVWLHFKSINQPTDVAANTGGTNRFQVPEIGEREPS